MGSFAKTLLEGIDAVSGKFHHIIGRNKFADGETVEMSIVKTDEVQAIGAAGLKLYDNSGDGLFIIGGYVYMDELNLSDIEGLIYHSGCK